MRLSLVALSLLGMTLAACQPRGALDPSLTLEAWIGHGDLVGAEVLVIRGSEIILHEAYGWKDREAGVPMQTHSIYSLASLTKPVTALAVLMLVDEGALSLDDPVSRYIPDVGGDPRATVRDLLGHTSGDGGEHGSHGYNVYDFATLAEWVDDWAPTESTAEYGQFKYSNFNYAALGYIVEQVSGIELGEFVTSRILRPLAMNDSYVSFSPDSSWADRVPVSYMWSAETERYEIFWTPDQPQRWRFFPATLGLWGTAADYARFMALWLDLGVKDGRRLVSEELVRVALQPQGFLGDEPICGLGWFVDPLRTEEDMPSIFRHGGGDGTLGLAYPADRGIVVYLSQSERPPDHVAAFQNYIAMSGFFSQPGPYMLWAATAEIEAVPLSEGQRSEVTGTYRGTSFRGDEVTWEVEVRTDGGVLELAMGEADLLLRDRVHLVPIGDDTFTYGRYEDGVLVGIDSLTRVKLLRADGAVNAIEVSFAGEPEFLVTRVGDVPS